MLEVLAFPVLAALAGAITRLVAGYLAEKTGHSRRAAEDAVATSGFSLVTTRKPDVRGDRRGANPGL